MRKIDEKKAQQARELLLAGKGLRSVAAATGLHRNTVAKIKEGLGQGATLVHNPVHKEAAPAASEVVHNPVQNTQPSRDRMVHNPLPRFSRSLLSAIEKTAQAMQAGGAAPCTVEQYLEPMRKVLAEMQAECPEGATHTLVDRLAALRATQVADSRPEAVQGAVDPLTLL
jgi:hypothetical protein